MIRKNITEIEYIDIKNLLVNKIEENDILDYKKELIKDNDLVKHVCAFANTRGGLIIFGIEESGNGGYPIKIEGIDTEKLNKEQMEQIILSNVVPRLDIKIKLVQIPETVKSILIIQIPNSHQKPHQSNHSKKFYRRFQFETAEMTEDEIADRYKSRFSNYEQVNSYVDRILPNAKENTITASIIVIPSNIEHRIIDSSDLDQIEKLKSMKISGKYRPIPLAQCGLQPFSHGLTVKGLSNNEFKIHRNGCIQHIYYDCKKESDTEIYFSYGFMVEKLINILQFASMILLHYNYFGDVKIIVTLATSSTSGILPNDWDYTISNTLDELNAVVEREYSVNYIETQYEPITSSIMNEIFNHYGIVKCPLFDKEGNLTNN